MRITSLRIICALVLCLVLQGSVGAATFTVTDTTDSGPGSLRAAILQANSNAPIADTILFNIPYAGVQAIFLSSQLPVLTDTAGVFIDGLSQPGASAGRQPPLSANILIELDGSVAGPAYGFHIMSPNNTIQGLSIGKFQQSGVCISGMPYPTRNNLIYCNFIGMDASGYNSRQNGWDQLGSWSGVEIVALRAVDYADRNTVLENIISSNWANGLYIGGNCQAYWNFVEGNYIGTDASGVGVSGNVRSGVVLDDGARLNTIRENIIGGNGSEGISLIGNSATIPPHYTEYNYILYNAIGVAKNKITPISNGRAGIDVGGYSGLFTEGHAANNVIGPGNTIAYNTFDGIQIGEHWTSTTNADGNHIWQNEIYDNGFLGIDLDVDGVSPNDPGDTIDTGANQTLNYPWIFVAYDSAGQTTLLGTVDIDTDPTLAKVEIFKAKVDPTGYGEGAVYLGFAVPDAKGFWTTTVTGVVHGDSVTATTTDVNLNTSEFSLCKEVLDALARVNGEAEPLGGMFVTVGPNPAAGVVSIRYATPTAAHVRLSVYDVSGRLVRNLVDVHKPGGGHTVVWDGKDRLGNQSAGGIYFIELKSGGRTRITKLVLIR